MRWIVVGPAPKLMSATDFSGTEPPLDGRHRQVLDRRQVARAHSPTARRGSAPGGRTARSWRCSGRCRPCVAMRIVWLSAAVVTPRSAARSSRGLISDLGPAQVAVDARRAQLLSALHLLDELAARSRLSRTGSRAGQHDRNVAAAAAAAALARKLTRASAICASCGRQLALESVLVRSRSFLSTMKMTRVADADALEQRVRLRAAAR